MLASKTPPTAGPEQIHKHYRFTSGTSPYSQSGGLIYASRQQQQMVEFERVRWKAGDVRLKDIAEAFADL